MQLWQKISFNSRSLDFSIFFIHFSPPEIETCYVTFRIGIHLAVVIGIVQKTMLIWSYIFFIGSYLHNLSVYILASLREKCPNTEFFLVRIFSYLDWIPENTDQKNSVFGYFLHNAYLKIYHGSNNCYEAPLKNNPLINNLNRKEKNIFNQERSEKTFAWSAKFLNRKQ